MSKPGNHDDGSAAAEAARLRYEQAMVDADIEGLARDPEAEALVTRWREEGAPIEDQIKRLKRFYLERQAAAE